MGLMLSVLVACVGVIELLTFYQNISRHLRYPPQRGDLSVISERYVRELGGIPRRPCEDFEKYQEGPPVLRLNSHEDVEIVYSEELKKSRSLSPRRFLVTETEESQRERSQSPRRFVVSEDPGGLKSSRSQDGIPEFLIQEDKDSEKSAHKSRYILKEKPNEDKPIPLPRQFLVSEETLNAVVFEDTDFNVPETSEIPLGHEHSPSPFLIVEPTQVPRNSICTELIEPSEEPLRSFNPVDGEKIDVILQSTNFNTTQYWTNKVLVVPSRRSKSRSVSPVRQGEDKEDIVKYDEKYLNDLDGVSKAKTGKRFGSTRKSIKRKNIGREQNSVSQNSIHCNTTEVLKHAAEELRKVTLEEVSSNSQPSTSESTQPREPKPGEPFWVKN